MQNLGNFNSHQYEHDIFHYREDEERKVHTPYVEPQDISLEYSPDIKPISSKIQFTLHDIAVAHKAKSRKTKTIEDPNSNKKCGHWSSDQNKRYHWFLELHHEHFFNKHLRRTDRIFKSMATFVETRQAEQCRSHHQKMEKKYKYFSKILISLRLQNYNSQDHKPILIEINEREDPVHQNSILTADQLKQNSQNIDQQHNQTPEIKTPKQKQLKMEMTSVSLPISPKIQQQSIQEQHKQIEHEAFDNMFNEREDSINNLLNDTYENNFNNIGAFFCD